MSDKIRALLNVKEAAKYLGVGRTLVYKLMDTGRLAYIKLGRVRRIRFSDLEQLVRHSRIGGEYIVS
jgi:excisionase family DNA binding protein